MKIDRQTLRNKILINHNRFTKETATYSNAHEVKHPFVGTVNDIQIIIFEEGDVELTYDGVTVTEPGFKNVYMLLHKHKTDRIDAIFGLGGTNE